MNVTLVCVVASLCALLCSGCASSETKSVTTEFGGRVEVRFVHPEGFTDVQSRAGGSTDEQILRQLRSDVIDAARSRIPAGTTLTITFTDLDLAGFCAPRHSSTSDIREVDAMYPPAAQFSWALTDDVGTVIRGGNENLVDYGFMSSRQSGDPLFYEKAMLRAWIRRTFR